MCLSRNVMIVCGVIYPGHPMFFTVNCMCNIEKHEIAYFAKKTFPLILYAPIEDFQSGLFKPMSFLRMLLTINNWFYGPLWQC